MIIKKEKYYMSTVELNIITKVTETRKKTTYWLLWIIPIFISDVVVKSNM